MRERTMTMVLAAVFLAAGAAARAQTNTFPASGNVGIGTTSPQVNLDVSTNTSQDYASGLGIRGSDNHYIRLYPSLGSGNYNYIVQAGDQAIIYSNGALSTGGFVIAPWVSGVTSGLRMDANGDVGIGTTAPGATLEVNGNVKLTSGSGASITFADGTVQSTAYTGVACGGDFAESVDVTGNRKTFEPGDLLAIDPKHPGKFLKSSTPYATAVLGVYSTKPGYVCRRLAGPRSPDELPMAMVGIVPTKVTAENGPIHPGDLLVSSSTPGYAMKGTDRSRMLGAVIGKALGTLESGKGVIEAGITLQ